MADDPELARLRAATNLDPNDSVYTDEVLQALLDANGGDQNVTASVIWREKAAQFSTLVDITEGSSSRRLSSLHSQALAMANSYTSAAGGVENSGTKRPGRTRAIERG